MADRDLVLPTKTCCLPELDVSVIGVAGWPEHDEQRLVVVLDLGPLVRLDGVLHG